MTRPFFEGRALLFALAFFALVFALFALFVPRAADAAPRYVATLTQPNPDGGLNAKVTGRDGGYVARACANAPNATVQFQTKDDSQGPFCIRTCTSTGAASTCATNCDLDYVPPRIAARTTVTATPSTRGELIAMGSTTCADVGAADGGAVVVNMLQVDPNN